MKTLAIAFTLALTVSLVTGATIRYPASSGKSIFLENKCSNCHSIASQGIERAGSPPAGGNQPPDLSTVGLRHNASWMTQWLLKEEEMNGKKHLKKFSGSDDDLATLTSWLASLKSAKTAAAPTPKPKPPQPHVEVPKAADSTPKPQPAPKPDSAPAAPAPATPAPPKTTGSALSDLISKHSILFAARKATPESDTELRYISDLLQKYPAIKIEIRGYCDSLESPAHSKDLSKKRAAAVRRFFLAHRIPAKRLTTTALGATLPRASNATEEGLQANRRVEFKIIK